MTGRAPSWYVGGMASLLPPVGWADVATKHDIESVHRDIELVRGDIARLDRTQHAFVGWLIASQATLFTAICAATALILRAL